MERGEPPGSDEEDAYIWVDHRAEETEILDEISARIAPEDALIVGDYSDSGLPVTYRGAALEIPLTLSPHDRYVAISSAAELLKERYRMFLLASSLSDDTHGLLVVSNAEADRWGPLPTHLVPLDLGFDYFNQIRVPYIGHTDEAPQFEADRDQSAAERKVGAALVELMLTDKAADAHAIQKIAQLVHSDPKTAAGLVGASPDELASMISKELAKIQSMPEVQDIQSHVRTIGNKVRATIEGRPAKKPWWNFWS